jgi:transposase
MELNYFIGSDISKNELDFGVMKGNKLLFHEEIPNDSAAIQLFIRKLVKLPGFNLSTAVFCMEHTGIYNNYLLVYLHKKKANICLEAATHIKNSLGNIRGKNDKIDAIRIAEYAYKNREELKFWQPKREIIQQLSQLAGTRNRLLNARKSIKTAIKENNSFIKKSIASQQEKLCAKTLKALALDIESVEKEMQIVIENDVELKRMFGLITSVDGIGKVTATQVIITTNEFKDINDPKKFACYAGVAPFTKESGLFKGKARVSHMANKGVKTLLHMSAISAISCNEELKGYYERKVKGENKNKMLVINAVRNKLILRIFACVNQNRKYEKNYMKLVA